MNRDSVLHRVRESRARNTDAPTRRCPVCGLTAPVVGHPCSFGSRKGPCSCWVQRPCDGGKAKAS